MSARVTDATPILLGADAPHAGFAAKGADIACPPEDQPYMRRAFQVRDLDGRLVGCWRDISRKN
jgi:uncharacterized glyoxalase superfamily protein PhnB